MSSHWIGTAAAVHVRIAVEGGFAMFSHGEQAAVVRTVPGDWVAYYSPRQGYREGAELRAFTAIGQVLPGAPGEREIMAGHVGWYRPVRWLAQARPADIYPLLDRFSFVKNRRHWGMYFRKSLFSIAATDFAQIAAAMGVGDEFSQAASQ
ncbi:MAG: EVE domain-containing protein [Nitratireductor sp.]